MTQQTRAAAKRKLTPKQLKQMRANAAKAREAKAAKRAAEQQQKPLRSGEVLVPLNALPVPPLPQRRKPGASLAARSSADPTARDAELLGALIYGVFQAFKRSGGR